MQRRRVFIADDHRLLREAFARLLERHCDVVGMAADGAELLERAVALEPDVILLDIRMPNLNGIEAARKLMDALPKIGIVFLTVDDDPVIAADALEAAEGACYLLKDCGEKELRDAISMAARGRSYVTPRIQMAVQASVRLKSGPKLTPRQRQVLQLLAEGKSMKQVAGALGLTARTVAYHKYAMMETLGAESSADLIRYAVHRGITT